MERLKWQLSQRQEEKTRLINFSLLRSTRTRKIVWIWVLGILNILELIVQAIVLYEVIETLVNATLNESSVGGLPYFYFILFPATEFASCGILFVWCLKPTFQMGVYSLMFSLASLAKAVVLGVVFLISLTSGSTNDLMGGFLLTSIIMLLIMLFLQRPFLWTCRNS